MIAAANSPWLIAGLNNLTWAGVPWRNARPSRLSRRTCLNQQYFGRGKADALVQVGECHMPNIGSYVWAVIAVAAAAFILLGVAVTAAKRRARTEQLQILFGPEYDRALHLYED